jgi:cell division protein FtsB
MKINIELYKQKIVQFTQRLGDIRFSGQIVFVILVLLITWSGVKSIQTNYDLQKQISVLKQENSVQALRNNNLKLQNDYFQTNQYLELAARQNFALANPGEKMLIVPESVALAYTVDIPSTTTEAPAAAKQPTYQKNIESWVNFFLHRPSAN